MTRSTYTDNDAEISRPGVSLEFLRAQRVRRVDAAEAEALLGFKPSGGGIWIPYHSPFNAGPVMANGRAFGRVRLDNPAKGAKYLSPKNSGAQLYVPLNSGPFGTELIICEGEFKTNALCEARVRAVGVGGTSSAMKDGVLIRDLARLIDQFKPKQIKFLGDADTALNYDFSREAVKLARALPASCVLSLPRILVGMPNGIDDCREHLGDEFLEFWNRINESAISVDRKIEPEVLAVKLVVPELPAIANNTDKKEILIQQVVDLASHLDAIDLDILAAEVKEKLKLSVVTFRKAAEKIANERRAKNVKAARERQTAAHPHDHGDGPNAAPPADELIRITFPPREERPTYACYDTAFVAEGRVQKAGVYYHGFKINKEGGIPIEEPVDTWICSPLKVACIVRDSAGSEHGYLVEYLAHGESTFRKMVFSQALLLGRSEELLAPLRDAGVSVLYQHREHVRDYLDKQHLRFSTSKTPDDFWRSTKKVGWDPAPECFILPDGGTLGKQTRVWFSGKVEKTIYAKKGTLEDWKTNIASLCTGNAFLMFAVSSAFAGPLLELYDIPGIGTHLFGDSTCGKTTTLVAAGSVWGPPAFKFSWKSTANGLESQAAIRSSTLIVLDESHEADAKTLDSAIYMLANGTAKARMTKTIAPREIPRWSTCVLSSGERSLETHLGAQRIEHKVGQGVRIVDVPVSGKHGLFDDLHGCKDGGTFSDKIRAAAAQHYGHAGPLFVEHLINKWSPEDRQFENAQLFFQAEIDEKGNLKRDDKGNIVVDSGLSAQEKRVARAFALVALAGELAIRAKIIPWQPGDAKKSARTIFELWRASQPRSLRGKEHAQIVQAIVDFVDQFGNQRFRDLDPVGDVFKMIGPQAGYFEDECDEKGNLIRRLYLFTSSGLKTAGGGFGIDRINAAIIAEEAFTRTDQNRRSVSRNIPEGGKKRLYHIDVEKLRAAAT